MTAWCAVSFGALDLRGTPSGDASGGELVATPIHPGEPVVLSGAPAALWRRLVDDPVSDEDLTVEERALVREFEEYGIASREADGAHVTHRVDPPWLVSPIHELVYALVANLAADQGIEVVFIKGPVLHVQGLRDREHSGDVDVWVAPDNIAYLADRVVEWGWSISPTLLSGTPFAHSITLRAGVWGCEIDAHYRFPGIDLPDQSALEALRTGTEAMRFAGVSVLVPDRETHAVIHALHLIRPTPGRPPTDETIAIAVDALARVEIASATAAVARFAAERPLRGVLTRAFAEPNDVPFPQVSDWGWRSAQSGVHAHLYILRALPARQRFPYLLRVIWLDDSGATSRRSPLDAIGRRRTRWSRAFAEVFSHRRQPPA